METPLTVTLAVLAAALLHAVWNAMLKSSADKQLDAIAIAAGGGLVALVAAPFLTPPAPAAWPWLAASVLVHIAYFWALSGAYRYGELSFTYPIMRGGAPVIVALAGIVVFGERLPVREALGALLICAGILGFAHAHLSGTSQLRRPLTFALGNAVVIACYTLIDAQGARASGSPFGYTAWFFVGNAVVLAAAGTALRGRSAALYLRRNWRRALAGGLLTVSAYGIVLWAVTLAPVALVAVMRETSVVFAAAIGALFLGEHLTLQRLVASAAVLAGLITLQY